VGHETLTQSINPCELSWPVALLAVFLDLFPERLPWGQLAQVFFRVDVLLTNPTLSKRWRRHMTWLY